MTIPPPIPPVAAKKSNGLLIGIIIVVGLVGLAVVAGIAVFGIAMAHRTGETNSIVKVVNKHAEIQNHLNVEMKDRAAFVPAFKRAVNDWHDIDTSACPTDFRVAYQRYLSTCDALVRELDTILGIINSKPYIERMQRAWDEVEACAVAHGCRFTRAKE